MEMKNNKGKDNSKDKVPISNNNRLKKLLPKVYN